MDLGLPQLLMSLVLLSQLNVLSELDVLFLVSGHILLYIDGIQELTASSFPE